MPVIINETRVVVDAPNQITIYGSGVQGPPGLDAETGEAIFPIGPLTETGLSATPGSSSKHAREDHDHGSPAHGLAIHDDLGLATTGYVDESTAAAEAHADGVAIAAQEAAETFSTGYTDSAIVTHSLDADPHGDRQYAVDVAAGAVADAASYTDTKHSQALAAADDMAQLRAAEALADANVYTDSAISTHTFGADPHGDRAYADAVATNEAAGAVATAAIYTDNAITAHLGAEDPHGDQAAAQSYAAEALADAQGYADTHDATTLASAQTYADGVAADALGDANLYTDSAVLSSSSELASYTDTAVSDALGTVAATYVPLSQLAADNGVATLDAGGRVPSNQLPALAIVTTTAVNSEAEMLALSPVQPGDLAVRTDVSRTYILVEEPATVLAHWVELATPPDVVQSVDGRTGSVALTDLYDASGAAAAAQAAAEAYADGAVTTHTGAVDPHGDRAYTDSAIGTHAADTTGIHGITDTSALVVTSDSRLTDARTPTAHATTHASAGSDPIAPGDIGAATSGHGHSHGSLSGVGANDHHNQAHDLTGSDHTASGLTVGTVLTALTSSTFGFAAPAATTINVYDTAGTTNWTKPSGAKLIGVWCIGGGGGGGSGRKGASGTGRYGGGGGAGGGFTQTYLDPATLAGTVSVTVGSGGSGGAARTASDTSGADGGAGGASFFGATAATAHVYAAGGPGGTGGATGNGPGGEHTVANSSSSFFGGGAGGSSSNGSGQAGRVHTWFSPSTGNGIFMTAGGGAGCGIGAANPSGAGGAGGRCGIGGQPNAPAGGTASAGNQNGANGTGYWIGSHGGGGGASAGDGSFAGGAGGNGGAPGGGGGGGGAGTNSLADSGKGGDGGVGKVVIVTWS